MTGHVRVGPGLPFSDIESKNVRYVLLSKAGEDQPEAVTLPLLSATEELCSSPLCYFIRRNSV